MKCKIGVGHEKMKSGVSAILYAESATGVHFTIEWELQRGKVSEFMFPWYFMDEVEDDVSHF